MKPLTLWWMMKWHYKWLVRPETSWSALLLSSVLSKCNSQAWSPSQVPGMEGNRHSTVHIYVAHLFSHQSRMVLCLLLIVGIPGSLQFPERWWKIASRRVTTSTPEQGIARVVHGPPSRSIWYLGWRKGWILDPEAGCSTFSIRHLWFFKNPALNFVALS